MRKDAAARAPILAALEPDVGHFAIDRAKAT
jgi:hypothetical protein